MRWFWQKKYGIYFVDLVFMLHGRKAAPSQRDCACCYLTTFDCPGQVLHGQATAAAKVAYA